MPQYLYEDTDGCIHHLYMTVDEMTKRQNKNGEITTDDGKKATRRMDLEFGGSRQAVCWSTPQISFALGVDVEDRIEASRRMEQAGVPTDFTKEGHAIVRSRGHRRQLCKAMGMRDTDAGYGDYAGETL